MSATAGPLAPARNQARPALRPNIGYLMVALALAAMVLSELVPAGDAWPMPSCLLTVAGDIAACHDRE